MDPLLKAVMLRGVLYRFSVLLLYILYIIFIIFIYNNILFNYQCE